MDIGYYCLYRKKQWEKTQVISNAFTRYTSLTFQHIPSGSADSSLQAITGLSLTIKDPSDTTLCYGMDERYVFSLTTAGGMGTLNANWGGGAVG
eukprot:41298_1